MTNLEILRLALHGVLSQINEETDRNDRARKEYGTDSEISAEIIEKLWNQYDELKGKILVEEAKQVKE